ncbi:hypothetical protein [Alkalilacustris brevis]|uniref:hypothetical protein n=1 Tax=Alkalilacustris brevis TaxID=2026338 RepID=UPI000E0DAC80|nr:hypothetical protein [Alkalilacustris brevis]
MTNVVGLSHEEGVIIDDVPLVRLVEVMGEGAAENVVNAAMREMSHRMAQMEQLYQAGEAFSLGRDARRLARIGNEIGMTSLSLVARDVQRCAARGDMIAFSATWSRLIRIADRSLDAIYGLAGCSGQGS